MQYKLYGLLAETSIHPGTGQDAGFVDQPVAREATTDYPVIVGSAAKGAIRDQYAWSKYQDPIDASFESKSQVEKDHLLSTAIDAAERRAEMIFGKSDEAGGVLVSDIRLLLLPVRSLTSSYIWITCSHLIERCQRDLARTGDSTPVALIPPIADNNFLGSSDLGSEIYLEERQFRRAGEPPTAMIELLSTFFPHASTQARLNMQLALLSDNDFAWFARYGLPIQARNSLDRQTKSSKNLWYEEVIPSDSLFYMLIAERSLNALNAVHNELMASKYLQVGGNETVGQGWFAIKHVE